MSDQKHVVIVGGGSGGAQRGHVTEACACSCDAHRSHESSFVPAVALSSGHGGVVSSGHCGTYSIRSFQAKKTPAF